MNDKYRHFCKILSKKKHFKLDNLIMHEINSEPCRYHKPILNLRMKKKSCGCQSFKHSILPFLWQSIYFLELNFLQFLQFFFPFLQFKPITEEVIFMLLCNNFQSFKYNKDTSTTEPKSFFFLTFFSSVLYTRAIFHVICMYNTRNKINKKEINLHFYWTAAPIFMRLWLSEKGKI